MKNMIGSELYYETIYDLIVEKFQFNISHMPKEYFVLQCTEYRSEFEMSPRPRPSNLLFKKEKKNDREYYFNPMTDSIRMKWKDITDFHNNIHLLQEFNDALILLKNRFLNMKAFW